MALSIIYTLHDCALVGLILHKIVLQAGEVWYEVAGELAQEGLRPVTPDQECLTEIWQTHEEKAEEILKKQVHSLVDSTIHAEVYKADC